ncbi:MAG: hypothetical protein LIP08_06445 [Bacteroides sp.]|nr:hypothetical protein [Bacteroides sp.]
MKELSIQVEIYPTLEFSASHIETSLNTGLISGYKLSADTFTFDPAVEESQAGAFYNCNKDLIIDTPDSSICNRFKHPISSIVRFRDTEGNNILIGTRELPAKVMIAPAHQRSRLKINCKMIKSPYSL